ncbi:hypothetical protein N7450_006639 [Penicillium hetheringtonii]|uniref:Major facilitator superfamily (MFS) profile domain-containing protein n=1 Tax=Penicillium hetheringtonii TaxID=911720 RepID=A0AAD6DIJ8_9EURO|nr:hypothetical protein N7450_006639 [Penicillium hetheringtonii]
MSLDQLKTEKEMAEHLERCESTMHESNDTGMPLDARKIVHKIDRRLITALGLMFAVSLMDRTNLASANIAGMAKELELDQGFRYSLSIIMFFVPHVICQWPSAILVQKLGPRIFLPGTVLIWGIVMLCFGFVENWGQLVALRVLVGIFEAGLLPGTILLLQMWYRRYDVHKRYASFYLISLTGSSFSGILAYGFMQMDGVGGLSGWRYIFIWEGVLTCLIGIIGALLIVDFPQKAQNSWKFLSSDEIAYVIQLLESDRTDIQEEPFSWRRFLSPAMDLKIWGYCFIYYANTVIAYAIAFFLPIILNTEMGFDVGISQILSTPPIFMFFEGWLGDKFRSRGPLIIWNCLQSICGLCLMAWVKSSGIQYFGVFLVTAASQSSLPCVMAWQANNICGQWKRSFSSASMVIMGGTGGITGALVFRSLRCPKVSSRDLCLLDVSSDRILVIGLSIEIVRLNKKASREDNILEGVPGFKYTT